MPQNPTDPAPSRQSDIIQGAYAVLLSEGLPHLSYDRIAKASGVTRQLVRYHFPDQEALMLRLCDHLAEVYREVLIRSLSKRADTERVDVFLDFYFDLIEGTPKPRDDQIYDALMSLTARSDRVRTALRDQYTLLGQVLTHELRQQYPEIPLPACEEIAYLVVVVMYGHWKMVASLGFSESHGRVSRRAIDRIIASYRIDSREVPGTERLRPER